MIGTSFFHPIDSPQRILQNTTFLKKFLHFLAKKGKNTEKSIEAVYRHFSKHEIIYLKFGFFQYKKVFCLPIFKYIDFERKKGPYIC